MQAQSSEVGRTGLVTMPELVRAEPLELLEAEVYRFISELKERLDTTVGAV